MNPETFILDLVSMPLLCHDATAAHAFRLLRQAEGRAERMLAHAWREHVIATAPERVARLGRATFDWPTTDAR